MSEWRLVPGLDHYEVDASGRVRRLAGSPKCRVTRIIKSRPTRHGYLKLTVYVNGKKCDKYVHRLVAEAFIGPIPSGTQVNHINGKKLDNNSSNLEYVTAAQNTKHAIQSGLRSSITRAKLTAADVLAIREFRHAGWKRKPLAERFGVSESAIKKVIAGNTWTNVA